MLTGTMYDHYTNIYTHDYITAIPVTVNNTYVLTIALTINTNCLSNNALFDCYSYYKKITIVYKLAYGEPLRRGIRGLLGCGILG